MFAVVSVVVVPVHVIFGLVLVEFGSLPPRGKCMMLPARIAHVRRTPTHHQPPPNALLRDKTFTNTAVEFRLS
jgi:hypothetical protein